MKKSLLVLGLLAALPLSSCVITDRGGSSSSSRPTSQDTSSETTSESTQESESSQTSSEGEKDIGLKPFTMGRNLTKKSEDDKFHPVIADYYFTGNKAQYLLYLGVIELVPIEIYSSTYISKEVVPVNMTLKYETSSSVTNVHIKERYYENSFSRTTVNGGSTSHSASSGYSNSLSFSPSLGLKYGVVEVGAKMDVSTSNYGNMSSSSSNHWSVTTTESHQDSFHSFDEVVTSESELVSVSYDFTANYEGTYAYGSYVDCEAYVYVTIDYTEEGKVVSDISCAYSPIVSTKTNGLIYSSRKKSGSETDDSIYNTRETDDKLMAISEDYLLALGEKDIEDYGEKIDGDYNPSTDFNFTIVDDEAVLTGANSYKLANKDIVRIPRVYDGCLVTKIQNGAFKGLKGIKQIIIPNSVDTIYPDAFRGCYDLISVHVNGNNLKRIYNNAFLGCVKLNNVTLPESVEVIDNAFDNCPSLVLTLKDNAYYLGAGDNPYHALVRARNKAIEEIKVMDGTVCVGAGRGFQGCTGIAKTDTVTLPSSVKSIGQSCFESVSAGNFVLPDSIVHIGARAFNGSKYIKTIHLPTSLEAIYNETFYNCTSLTEIVIPNSVKTIGGILYRFHYEKINGEYSNLKITISSYDYLPERGAFFNCTSLASITLGSGVKYIFGKAFYKNAITTIDFPDSLILTSDYPFEQCDKLTSVNIGKGFNMSYAVFYSNRLETATVDEENPNIKLSNKAFLSKDGTKIISVLKSASGAYLVNDGVTIIDNYSFYHCELITSVTNPNGLTNINYRAFEGCKGLTSINMPSSLTMIGESAFAYCSSLGNVTLPSTLVWMGKSAFEECKSFTEFVIPEKIMDRNTATATKVFCNDLLKGCTSLVSLTMPRSDIKNLFGNNVPASLKEVTIYGGIGSIGNDEFRDLRNLEAVFIPSSVEYIGYRAFNGCTNCTIYCEASSRQPEWADDCFGGVKSVVYNATGIPHN